MLSAPLESSAHDHFVSFGKVVRTYLPPRGLSLAVSIAMDQRGLSLVEVLIALLLLAGATGGLLRLILMATMANQLSLRSTMATMVARRELEQLRVGWLPVTTGETLGHDVEGAVAWFDGQGHRLALGTVPTAEAAYLCRWTILPLPPDDENTHLLQVVAWSVNGNGNAFSGRSLNRVHLVAIQRRAGQ